MPLLRVPPRAAILGACLLLAICEPAGARSAFVRRDFQRLHPCPATNLPRGACPGWVADHVIPLCAGGLDAVSNLEWQTAPDAAVKDGTERRICRAQSEDGQDHPAVLLPTTARPPSARPR